LGPLIGDGLTISFSTSDQMPAKGGGTAANRRVQPFFLVGKFPSRQAMLPLRTRIALGRNFRDVSIGNSSRIHALDYAFESSALR
jgi:hypothetical protein